MILASRHGIRRRLCMILFCVRRKKKLKQEFYTLFSGKGLSVNLALWLWHEIEHNVLYFRRISISFKIKQFFWTPNSDMEV